MKYKTDFGQFISEHKLKCSLQSQELAKRLGVSLGYLSQLEHGKRLRPNVEILKKMIEIFKLETEEINELYDLYADMTGQTSPDIIEYIKSDKIIIKALRCARDSSATNEHWERFIKLLKNEQ